MRKEYLTVPILKFNTKEKCVDLQKREDNTKEKYLRIKNVFRFFIDHAPYLVDDKSYERCEKKSAKEQFAIKIDAICYKSRCWYKSYK